MRPRQAIEVLPPALAGSYAYLNACLVPEPHSAPDAFAIEDMVATQLARYAASLGPCDRRAVASMWWQYYMSFLLPPLVTLYLTAPKAVPATARPRFDPHGLVRCFAVAGRCRDDDPSWFDEFQSAQLVPIADTLQRLTGVAPRALWSNAAARLAGLCGHLATLPAPYRFAAERGRAMLSQPTPVRSIPCLGAMLRESAPRVCCLRYRLPGFAVCGNCPRETVISRGTHATSGRSTV